MKLRAEIGKLPQKPTIKQQLKIACMCACLAKQVKDFLQAATLFLPALEEVDLSSFKEEEMFDTPAEEAAEPEDLDVDDRFERQDEAEVPSVHPEVSPLKHHFSPAQSIT